MLELRNGLARGILNRSHLDSRLANRATADEVQLRLSTTLSYGGFSACRVVLAANQADVYKWYDANNVPDFAQEASASSHFAQRSKPRVMTQEGTLKGDSDWPATTSLGPLQDVLKYGDWSR